MESPSSAPPRSTFSVVELALRRPYTFIVMAMLIVLATPFALMKMPTDIFPEIDIPVVSVVWNYRGLSAQEMGQRITGQTERSLTTTVSDIEQAHRELTDRGVEISEIQHFEHGSPRSGPDPQRAPFNSFIFFADPDGNRWAIQEGAAASGG